MICFSTSVLAETATPDHPDKNLSAFTNWPVVLMVLVGMIVFIYALAWFVKRFGGMNFTGSRDMKVVTSITLGSRERIALIDVRGQQFLIGVTTQQVSHLHSFDEAIIPMAGEEKLKQSDFMSKLQSVLNPQMLNGQNQTDTQKRDADAS